MKARKKLILFDVDDLLIKEKGMEILLGRWDYALNRVFGVPPALYRSKTVFQGLTDGLILLDLGRVNRISRKDIVKNSSRLFRLIAEFVRLHVKESELETNPGVRALLPALKKKGYVLGLLTGNLPAVAKMKLKKVGIGKFFSVGAYGDSFKPRSTYVSRALKSTNSKFCLQLRKTDAVYFGDAPNDVIAGKGAGVRMIAVATGRFSVKTLKSYKPYKVLKDLSDKKEVLKLIAA